MERTFDTTPNQLLKAKDTNSQNDNPPNASSPPSTLQTSTPARVYLEEETGNDSLDVFGERKNERTEVERTDKVEKEEKEKDRELKKGKLRKEIEKARIERAEKNAKEEKERFELLRGGRKEREKDGSWDWC